MIAAAADEISCGASGLASGSMSEEFSGQMTTIGCGARPARTSSASRSVSRTWLSSTARRWALNSSPSRGTLPCTAATVIGWSSPAPGTGLADMRPRQRRRQQHGLMHTPGQHDRGRRGGVGRHRRGHQRTISSAMAATLNPISTTAKDTSGAPPICASGSSGAFGLAETDYAPRESAERHRRLEPFLRRPQPREPERPAGQPPTRDGEQTEQAGKQRLARWTGQSTAAPRPAR